MESSIASHRSKRLRDKAAAAVAVEIDDDSSNNKRVKAEVDHNGSNNDQESAAVTSSPPLEHKRWKAHQMAQDYVEFAANLVYQAAELGPYGYHHTLEGTTALGYLTSPLRRPTVLERWSPYEICVFEASLAKNGKEFHIVQKHIRTKTVQEIVDFYYIWKKTTHYARWKTTYIPAHDDVSDDDDEETKKT